MGCFFIRFLGFLPFFREYNFYGSSSTYIRSILDSPTLKNLIFVKGHVKLLCTGRKLVYTRFPRDVKRRGIYPAYLALIMYYKYPILYVSHLPPDVQFLL